MRDWTYSNNGEMRSIAGYYTNDERWVKTQRQVKCCGEWLDCDGFTNTCGSCGADYNMSGQRLAPRSQWGEETGESVEDILSVDYASPEELLG